MGTQKAIAAEIIGGKADYVLALKRNHESLHAAVIEHVAERLDGDIGTAQELTTTDHGHGREEQRTYLQLPAPEGLPGKGEWEGLKSVGVVTSRRKEGQEESLEVRYYLSSLPVDVDLFARAVRGHWSQGLRTRFLGDLGEYSQEIVVLPSRNQAPSGDTLAFTGLFRLEQT
jgi:predicted transposase YbfD/YdcC